TTALDPTSGGSTPAAAATHAGRGPAVASTSPATATAQPLIGLLPAYDAALGDLADYRGAELLEGIDRLARERILHADAHRPQHSSNSPRRPHEPTDWRGL